MSDLVVARNCCMARMLPGEAENGVGMNRSAREAKSVKRFERSNGLDTAIYKLYLYLFFLPFYLSWALSQKLSQDPWAQSVPSHREYTMH